MTFTLAERKGKRLDFHFGRKSGSELRHEGASLAARWGSVWLLSRCHNSFLRIRERTCNFFEKALGETQNFFRALQPLFKRHAKAQKEPRPQPASARQLCLLSATAVSRRSSLREGNKALACFCRSLALSSGPRSLEEGLLHCIQQLKKGEEF